MSLTSVPTVGARPLAQPRRRRSPAPGAAAGDDDAVRRREARGDRVADAGGAAADQGGPTGDGCASRRTRATLTVVLGLA